jgi:hypothetical protein
LNINLTIRILQGYLYLYGLSKSRITQHRHLEELSLIENFFQFALIHFEKFQVWYVVKSVSHPNRTGTAYEPSTGEFTMDDKNDLFHFYEVTTITLSTIKITLKQFVCFEKCLFLFQIGNKYSCYYNRFNTSEVTMHRPYFPLLLTLLIVSVTSLCAIPVTILLYIFLIQNRIRRKVFSIINHNTTKPLLSSQQHLQFEMEQRGTSSV